MLQNYIKTAIRTLRKNPGYTFLNVFGLVLGFSCSLIIFLYVHNEFTYDSHHINADDIYRLNCTYYLPNDAGQEDNATMGAVVANRLVDDYDEIIQRVRIRRYINKLAEREDGTQFYETLHYADSNIFQLFTFPLLHGDSKSALEQPYNVVLSQDFAQKYFNRLDVVGESIEFPEDSMVLQVTGVFEKIPGNSHLKFDMLASFETLYAIYGENRMSSWWSFSTWSYLGIDPLADVEALEKKIKRISENYIKDQEEGSGYFQEYSLINLKDIHLYSNLRGEFEPTAKASNVLIFLIVGVFILVIASINFMNLATARSANRAREIGVRKASGAHRSQLIRQFLVESIIITSISMLVASIIVMLVLPQVGEFTDKDLSMSIFKMPWLLPAILGTTIFVGVISGIYPAFFLSAFKPIETLRGSYKTSVKGNWLRQVLVISQFTIGIFLIAGTILVYKQLNFLRTKSLGFQKEQVVYIPSRYAINAQRDFTVLKKEVENLADVSVASLSSRVPGVNMGNNVVRLGWSDDAEWSDMRFITVDDNFMELYEIELVAGRSFDKDVPSDHLEAFLLNESGMKRLGWSDPNEAIGQELSFQGQQGRVIGIIKDFHFMSTNQAIQPFLMVHQAERSPGYLSIKLSSENFNETLRLIESSFSKVMPGKVFDYSFLDSDFAQQYEAEERFMTIFSVFSILAILVACLGLYGLASFVAQNKFKEIGIRKVLGASTISILVMFNSNFSKLVVVALIISIPLSYFAAQKWISSFPYQTSVSWWVFILSGLLALVISWLTVAYQSIRATTINPVESINTD